MTSILRIRCRRFHALYALLTGDVGLPAGSPHERADFPRGHTIQPGRP